MKTYTCIDTGEVVIGYDNYLRTSHWKKLRERFKESKFAQTCYLCDGSEQLNLHHKSYKRVGNEKLNDLIWLCSKCHSSTHNELRKNKSIKTNLWNISRKIRRKQVRKVEKQERATKARVKKCQKFLDKLQNINHRVLGD